MKVDEGDFDPKVIFTTGPRERKVARRRINENA